MSDERSSHPLDSPARSSHPLSDMPPKSAEAQGVRIPIPLAAKMPIVTYALVVINVAIFLLRYIQPQLATEMIYAGYLNPDAVIHNREVYRLFTAMFLHLNEVHILFNSIALYYIGGNLERYFGHLRFGIVYLLGGLAGSILPLFFNSGGLGASGAVFAIWGAEAVFLYQHLDIFGAAGRARLKSSMMLMIVNFLAGLSANALGNFAEGSVQIGNSAHFAGLIGGAILAWFVSPRFVVKRKNEDPKAGEINVEVVQVNTLASKTNEILYYSIGLVALLLIAILLRS